MAKKISLANRKVNKQVHDTVGQEKKGYSSCNATTRT